MSERRAELTESDYVSKWYLDTRFACVQLGTPSSWRCRQDCRQWTTGKLAGKNRPVMPAVTEKGRKPMREQLRRFRLGVIGAMSVACILATTSVSNAAGLTAPVVTTTGTYQGLQ